MKSYKVLFCDDDEKNCKDAILLFLRKFGYEVAYVDNLADAEHHIIHSPGADYYNMFILDLKMPSKDLPMNLREKCRNNYAGWIFYKNYIENTHLKNKTVFCTGSSERFKEVNSDKQIIPNVLNKEKHDFYEKLQEIMVEILKKN